MAQVCCVRWAALADKAENIAVYEYSAEEGTCGYTPRGYTFAHGTRYTITIYTPAGAGCPAQYHGTGGSCYEALAAAVQLFHDTAHTYPGAMAYAPQ